MRLIDVDSHFHEPLDWLQDFYPDLARELPPVSQVEFILQFTGGDLLAAIAPDQRPDDERPLVPSIRDTVAKFPNHAEQTAKFMEEAPGCWDIAARLRLCDDQGIAVQLINNTYGRMPYMKAQQVGRQDLAFRAAEAYNTLAAEHLHGHTDRLIPVALIVDLVDVPWAISEMTRMREAGSRAFHINAAPVSSERSLTHPDLDAVWSAAEDLGMVVLFHAGPAGPAQINPGWFANGGNPATFGLLNQLHGPAVKTALAAMIFDGVFERHPKLVVLVEELGIEWLPEFLRRIDSLASSNGLTQKTTYELPLVPSEYMRRQVRVSALPAKDALRPTIDVIPPELVVFSTDYPHVEGTDRPIEIFEEQLEPVAEDLREQFFGASAAQLIGV